VQLDPTTREALMDAHHDRQHGFSVIELLVTMGLMATIIAMAILMTKSSVAATRGDGAVQAVAGLLREGRERAIADRRNVEVWFTDPNHIELRRREVDGVTETGDTTLIGSTDLEGGVRFQPLPSTMPDTPDGFGKTGAYDFGSATTLIFTSEGTFVNQSGEPLNGTVFLAIPGDEMSIRAVTVFGPTALVHGYRWNGNAWTN
jgi:prepilin-type N-terminal cleavage/methylation domain-containing protein